VVFSKELPVVAAVVAVDALAAPRRNRRKMSMKANFHRAAVLKAKLSHRVNAL
jgi:hypothetical protein